MLILRDFKRRKEVDENHESDGEETDEVYKMLPDGI
jgi:hypothetical protein